jgi:hypothetical protein
MKGALMAGRRLSREEVQKRRESLRSECRDYVPTRGGHQCQHYAGEGACKRPDYFMCVVWAKRNPEAMYHVERPAKKSPSEKPSEPRRDAVQPEEKYPSKPATAQVYDLSAHGVARRDGGQHLLEHPELLTEAAVAALCKLGIEVTVKTSAGTEVTLVPELTEAERCELTFEHARTIVMVLQVFPGATIEHIVKPKKQEAS